MKLSEIYLPFRKTQAELDFVDVDVEGDIALFIDPSLIRKYCDDDFGTTLLTTIDSFFDFLNDCLKQGMNDEAMYLCSHLGEVNETHLGFSIDKSMGKGVGKERSEMIFNTLNNHKAITGGAVKNIEDLKVLVEGFGPDLISDMVTNIIKMHLIEYTIWQCELSGIELENNKNSGFFWNPNSCKWEQVFTKRLIYNNKPLLLVPRRIVSLSRLCSDNKYRQGFVLDFLQEEYIKSNSPLVRLKKKNNEPYVCKKDIIECEPKMDKNYLTSFTLAHIDVFDRFKDYVGKNVNPQLKEKIDNELVCSILKDKLISIAPGKKEENIYQDVTLGVIEFLCHPKLNYPKKEQRIHGGRKRVDITFCNSSYEGFFSWVKNELDIPCPYVFIECKNYNNDIGNEEFDQLSGRFSNTKGKLGLLMCRKIADLSKSLKTCSDTFKDGRGLMIPILDDDIIQCLLQPDKCSELFDSILVERARKIILEL